MTTPTWIITGASSGFGMAFARYALSRGYNVVATARTPAKLDAIRRIAPNRVLVEKLDVTVSGDAEKAVAAATARFGTIDVLLKTAHYGETWEEIERAVVQTLLPNDVGLMGKPDDVGAVVAFLASPLSRFVSGANWRVDGGSTTSIN